jgi:hypothetical protein
VKTIDYEKLNAIKRELIKDSSSPNTEQTSTLTASISQKNSPSSLTPNAISRDEVAKFLEEIIGKGPGLQNSIGNKSNLMANFTSLITTLNLLLKYLLNHNSNPTTYNQTSEFIKKLQENLEGFGTFI